MTPVVGIVALVEIQKSKELAAKALMLELVRSSTVGAAA